MSDEGYVFNIDDLTKAMSNYRDGNYDNQPEVKAIMKGVETLLKQNYGPFISGVGPDKDGYPETIHVCYNFGVNYGGVYKLIRHGRTGQ